MGTSGEKMMEQYPRSAASGEEQEKSSFFDYFTFGIVNIAIVIGVMLL
jgi:hypothetical protein